MLNISDQVDAAFTYAVDGTLCHVDPVVTYFIKWVITLNRNKTVDDDDETHDEPMDLGGDLIGGIMSAVWPFASKASNSFSLSFLNRFYSISKAKYLEQWSDPFQAHSI